MRIKLSLYSLIIGILVCTVASTTTAAEQDARDYYRGRTITYLVSGGVGTGYDLTARLLARHMERFLPGTRIRIQNVTGAGGIVAANRLYRARPDGLLLATLNTGLIYSQLMELDGVGFDLQKMQWLGKAEADPRVVFTAAASGIATIEQLINYDGRLLMVATTGAGSAANNEAMMIGRALGLNMQMVAFTSSNEGNLSMLRGEMQARIGSYATAQRFVSGGEGVLLAVVGKNSHITEALPDLHDYAVDDTGRALLSIIEAVSRFGRYTVMPPDESPARVAYLRGVYRQALEDPALLAEAEQMGLDIEPLYGEALEREIVAILNQPPAVIELLKSIGN